MATFVCYDNNNQMKTLLIDTIKEYHSPDISLRELSLEGFLCSSNPLATYAELDPWVEETYDDDIVLIQDR